jgi:hypothetical protein
MSLSIEILGEIAKKGCFSANRGTHKDFDAVLMAIEDLDETGFLRCVTRRENCQTGKREIDHIMAIGLTAAGRRGFDARNSA